MLSYKCVSFWTVIVFCSVTSLPDWGERSCKLTGTVFVTPRKSVIPGQMPSGSYPGTQAGSPITSRFTISTTAGTTTGTVVSGVYDDHGTLDFYYQVSNDATSALPLVAVEDTSFAGYKTCVGYRTDGSSLRGFQDGTNIPVSAQSSFPSPAAGLEISFFFNPPPISPPQIGPGMTSQVLVSSTNATQSNNMGATIVLHEAAGATVSAYEPVAISAILRSLFGGRIR